jgi:KDO2-lipid IV(A) lauroyltransferase
MSAISFYIFYALNWIITLLPLKILYLFSDFLFVVFYRITGYRKKVIRTNLRNAFPEKTDLEREAILRNFYRHLADLFVEVLKLTHMSRTQLKRRFIVENPELLVRLKAEGKDIVAVTGHYNNWEWMASIPLYTDYKCISIYKPLKNKHFNWFLNHLRGKYGMNLTPMSTIIRELIKNRNENINTLSAFIGDQIPAKGDINYWTDFLNQETAVYLGAEKIAAKYNMVVVFFNQQKVKRGYYRLRMEVITEDPASLPEHEITDRHVRRLDEIIKQNPSYWIWSHRRWKHKRENDA